MNKLVKKLKKLKDALDLLEEKEDKILMAIDDVIDELEDSSED